MVNLDDIISDNAAADGEETVFDPQDLLDSNPKQLATLESECEIVATLATVNFENIIPEEALPHPAHSFVYKGKPLRDHLVPALKEHISKFSKDLIEKYTSEKVYNLNKQPLVLLLYQLITHSQQQQ